MVHIFWIEDNFIQQLFEGRSGDFGIVYSPRLNGGVDGARKHTSLRRSILGMIDLLI